MTRRLVRSCAAAPPLLLAVLASLLPSARLEAQTQAQAPAQALTQAQAQAQTPTTAAAELRGRVERVGEPLAGVGVVLHRIARDQAGEIDTVAAGPQGDFTFVLPSLPTPEAEGDVYFASVRHQGILYFGSAISRVEQLDTIYAIEAFDTIQAPAEGSALPVAVRYLVAEPAGPEGAGWRVTDLFEVANEGDRTLVAAGDTGLTWTHPLPAGVTQLQIGGGDLSPDAAQTVDGRLELSGPIPPGQRQFIVRYEVPDLAEFVVPLAPGTREVEMLLAEPSPAEEVVGLAAVETIEVQPGLSFRRYTGQFERGGVLRLVLTEAPREWPLRQLVVGLGFLLAVVGLWAALRTSAPGDAALTGSATGAAASGASAPGASPTGRSGDDEPRDGARPGESRRDHRNRLLLEIARIDDELESLAASPADAAGADGATTASSAETGGSPASAPHAQALRDRRVQLLDEIRRLG